MNPIAAADLALAIASVVVHVAEDEDKTVVRFLGIPVYNSTWEGVKRRKARRAARRAKRRG